MSPNFWNSSFHRRYIHSESPPRRNTLQPIVSRRIAAIDAMPKFFCDYCDVYLTHDSMSVRKAHNTGRNHLRNVVEYYQQIGQEKAQSVIDSITNSYAAEGQASNNPMLQHAGAGPAGFGAPGALPPGFPAPPGGAFPPPGESFRVLPEFV